MVDHPSLFWVNTLFNFVWDLVVFNFWFLFPDGRYVPRWTRWLMLLIVPFAVLDSLSNVQLRYFLLDFLFVICMFIIAGSAQIYRYRHISNLIQRQQTKWFVVFAVSTVIVWVSFNMASLIFPRFDQDILLYDLVLPAVVTLIASLVPVAIGIAMLRYKLFAIDFIINRALVWGVLSASVIGICALIIAFLSWFLNRNNNNIATSTVAAIIAVAIILPLYKWVQQGVDRLVYGQRYESLKVLKRLNQRLEAALKPDAVLPMMAEAVVQALKLPYVAIAIKDGDTLSIAAETGSPVDMSAAIPLIYQNEAVGELWLAPRTPGEKFTSDDYEFLNNLKSEAALVVHNIHLTTELQHMNEYLHIARKELVNTHEEERSRLRNDLHDSILPDLAALNIHLNVARKKITHDPVAAQQTLSDLEHHIKTICQDIRDLSENLLPQKLAELGLVRAIEALAAQRELCFEMQISDPLPELPTAVKVAAYRISQEALTNVAKHAHARHCFIRLSFDNALQLEIIDDGKGIVTGRKGGLGLPSMRTRAEELGGTFHVKQRETGGTRILARLPSSLEVDAH